MDQATCHLHSSNLNLLEHLSRRLDDSFNVLNVFLSRCEELNMSENLTTNIRRLLEELHSIHTRIFHIIINEHDFVLNSNHPYFVPSAEPTYTGLGGHDKEFQQLKLIDSTMYTGLGKMLLFIWEFQ